MHAIRVAICTICTPAVHTQSAPPNEFNQCEWAEAAGMGGCMQSLPMREWRQRGRSWEDACNHCQ